MARTRVAALALIATLMPLSAAADELPRRKPGQWEITTTMSLMAGQKMVMHQCIDKNTDADLLAQANRQPGDCAPPRISRSGNRTVIETTCKMERSTVATRGEFTGNYESAYQGEVRSTFSPPLEGIKESHMAIAARWLGPCPAGQKPGSATMQMPGMGNIDIGDMMKNMPKMPGQ